MNKFHPQGIEYIDKVVGDIFEKFEVTHWWYNINPKGAWNLPHSHGGADYALVWYLTDSDGLLQLMNPHTSRKNSQDVSFNAKKGDIVLFPSDLVHYVLPNPREEDRISISMNLQLS